MKGIGASSGIGIGRAMVVKSEDLSYTPKNVQNTQMELERYHNAVEIFCKKTTEKAELILKQVGEKEASILLGHIVMISDPYMNAEIEKLISSSQCAESAVENVCDMFIAVFSSADDELTIQRAADVKDIKTGVLRILLGREEVDIAHAPANTVLVAEELTPSMAAGINKNNIVGIVTATGGRTSHSAILARAMEIPAVLSVENLLNQVQENCALIVDGIEGLVIANPEIEQTTDYTRRKDEYIAEKKALGRFIGKETLTSDGKKVEIFANICSVNDAIKAMDCDAEGIGLFRTEFLYMDRNSVPTEEEQFEAYKQVAIVSKGKEVIIRTLDIGGDKEIPYLGLEKEENPFLGFRAIRFCLANEDLYRVQLRALLRASAFGGIRVMVPFVTSVDELRQVRAIVAELKSELNKKNIDFNENIKIGVMVETAAGSLIADLLAKEADFFSIGTNDLTQYTLSVDRGNSKVSYLYSHFHPAVLRSIKHIISCAKAEKIPVGMCGEAASDEMLVPLLLAFGLDEFSVSNSSVLATRRAISCWSQNDADKLARSVMALSTENEVEEMLSENKR